MTTRLTFTRAIRDFRRALPNLLLYEILFQIVAFIVLTPGVVWLIRKFVATSGNKAIGNFDIALFLLTPLGVTVSLVLTAMYVTISFAKFGGLFYIGAAAACDRNVTYAEALFFILKDRLWKILKVSFLVLLVLALAALPFVFAALLTARGLITEHDINYYLDVHPPEFTQALAIGGALALAGTVMLAIVSVPFIFVLPETLFGGASAVTTLMRSRMLAGKLGFRRIATTVLIWIVAWTLCSAGSNAIIYSVGRFLVRMCGESVAPLLIVLGTVTTISLLLNYFIAFAAISIGCLTIFHLYEEACHNSGITLPTIALNSPALEAKPQWNVPAKAPIAAAIGALLFTLFVAQQVLEDQRLDDQVQISAHRGASLEAPENSLSAVKQAIVAGADFVEIDVQRTSDGVIVVNHDADLMRVGRSPLVISQSTLEELQAVDVGSQFGADFADERIATLEEVIEVAKGEVKLIVELKSYQDDPNRLVAEVVQILADQDMNENAVIMSLEYDEVVEVERIAPEIVSGYVASASLGDISKLSADFLAVSKTKITPAFVAAAHASGKEVFVWTVDDPDEMFTMIDRGVDNIITNDPATAVSVLSQREGLSNVERILLRFKSLYVM